MALMQLFHVLLHLKDVLLRKLDWDKLPATLMGVILVVVALTLVEIRGFVIVFFVEMILLDLMMITFLGLIMEIVSVVIAIEGLLLAFDLNILKLNDLLMVLAFLKRFQRLHFFIICELEAIDEVFLFFIVGRGRGTIVAWGPLWFMMGLRLQLWLSCIA